MADDGPAPKGGYPRPAIVTMVVVGFVMLVMLSVVIGVGALIYTNQTHDRAAKNAANAEALALATCISSNVGRSEIRAALKDALVGLVPAGTVLSDDQKARIATYNATVDARLPFRDCSKAGIAAYIANPPSDPGVP